MSDHPGWGPDDLPRAQRVQPVGVRRALPRGKLLTLAGLLAVAYPGYILPANLPLQPLAWPNPRYDATTMAISNPSGPGAVVGYVVALCNLSNQPQKLASIIVKVAAFTPFSGTLNEVRACPAIYHPCPGL